MPRRARRLHGVGARLVGNRAQGDEGPLWPTPPTPTPAPTPGTYPGQGWGGGGWGPPAPGRGAPGGGAPGAPVPGGAPQRPADERLGPNTRCYEHPERFAGAVCRSCGQPICSDCMVEAPVGWQCRRCVHRAARTTPVVRYRPGAGGLSQAGRAPVTLALILVNVVLYVVASGSQRFAFNSYEIPYYVQQGQWYRLFSSFFVTNDFLDVALNMFSLYIIGRLVEPALEKWRYLAVYLLSGFGGSVATYLLGRLDEASAGASGAIFGLVGAYFILARRARLNTSGIVGLIAINLIFDFTYSGINWLAHLGGLAVGLVVATGFAAGGKAHRTVATIVTVACTCAVLGLLMLFPPGRIALE